MGRNNMFVAKANGTIAPAVFVKLDTTADNAVIAAAANTDFTVGISQIGQKRAPGLPGSSTTIAAEAGDFIQLFGVGDVCLLTIGSGGCTAGDMLTSDGSGNGVTASSAQIVGARALQTVAASAQALVQILAAAPLS